MTREGHPGSGEVECAAWYRGMGGTDVSICQNVVTQEFPSVKVEQLRFAHFNVSKCTTTIRAKKVCKINGGKGEERVKRTLSADPC